MCERKIYQIIIFQGTNKLVGKTAVPIDPTTKDWKNDPRLKQNQYSGA